MLFEFGVIVLLVLVVLWLVGQNIEGFRVYGPGGARAYGAGWYDPRMWGGGGYPIGGYDPNMYPSEITRGGPMMFAPGGGIMLWQ